MAKSRPSAPLSEKSIFASWKARSEAGSPVVHLRGYAVEHHKNNPCKLGESANGVWTYRSDIFIDGDPYEVIVRLDQDNCFEYTIKTKQKDSGQDQTETRVAHTE